MVKNTHIKMLATAHLDTEYERRITEDNWLVVQSEITPLTDPKLTLVQTFEGAVFESRGVKPVFTDLLQLSSREGDLFRLTHTRWQRKVQDIIFGSIELASVSGDSLSVSAPIEDNYFLKIFRYNDDLYWGYRTGQILDSVYSWVRIRWSDFEHMWLERYPRIKFLPLKPERYQDLDLVSGVRRWISEFLIPAEKVHLHLLFTESKWTLEVIVSEQIGGKLRQDFSGVGELEKFFDRRCPMDKDGEIVFCSPEKTTIYSKIERPKLSFQMPN